jgi:hypothetical protein
MYVNNSSLSEELESLLEERRQLTEEHAGILSQFGQTGTHSMQKDILKAEISNDLRANYLADTGDDPTETRIKNEVPSDPRYRSFYNQVIQDRTAWYRITEQREAIHIRIRFLLAQVCSTEETAEPV